MDNATRCGRHSTPSGHKRPLAITVMVSGRLLRPSQPNLPVWQSKQPKKKRMEAMRRSRVYNNISKMCDGSEPTAGRDKNVQQSSPTQCVLQTLPTFCFAPPTPLAPATAAPRLSIYRDRALMRQLGRSRWLNGRRGCLNGSCADGTGPRPLIEP